MDTGADGRLLPLQDLCKVKPDVDLDSLAHTINSSAKLGAYTELRLSKAKNVFG